MKYIITNGKSYIRKTPKNEIRVTCERSEATTFDNENKAWNVVSCLPRAYKNNNYLS